MSPRHTRWSRKATRGRRAAALSRREGGWSTQVGTRAWAPALRAALRAQPSSPSSSKSGMETDDPGVCRQVKECSSLSRHSTTRAHFPWSLYTTACPPGFLHWSHTASAHAGLYSAAGFILPADPPSSPPPPTLPSKAASTAACVAGNKSLAEFREVLLARIVCKEEAHSSSLCFGAGVLLCW
eukprot:CAMPEP_0196579932 /NCGR_PEP_ID=MMETSP1081-20130531/25804_1 /TAXON_ID=36882 /ORGANISM="Pyramimonas amylifera, Strain CCMP720" /LENGTH=182 /DNA_ID=CAMNT_0041899657 /DNA_START=673 /DNA_END=1218 /DNA_ORIENTATION=-